ncbi:MAG: hypothetical protein HOV71_03925 [Hamadaea sp.]|nr:hypothetical protein [Hamadaea sp.]NUR47263.1 hypothetical protein [Hamadaea sp.]NUT03920.1 hypothetical protein [Hamadaea sp.]
MAELPVIESLDRLARLVGESGDDLFVRWSRGPHADRAQASHDDLTGASLPGLSANPLAVEPWWGDRSRRFWVARRLHDYSHLEQTRGPGVRPWVLRGEQTGRGPDNEPLVLCREPVGWVAERVLDEAERLVDSAGDADWGPLDRRSGDD